MSYFVRVAGVLTSVAGAKLIVEIMFDGDKNVQICAFFKNILVIL